MIVDVIWTLGRGWWDQAALEALFGGSLYRLPSRLVFQHRTGLTNHPDLTGAIVIIPGQHAVSQVATINRLLERLDWALVIIGGDEEALFPVHELTHPRMRVWVQTPRPKRHEDAARRFGVWWPPGCRETLRSLFAAAPEKTRDWYYSGQVQSDNPQRVECVDVLKHQLGKGANAELYPTLGFAQGYPGVSRDERYMPYLERLASARLAPAPSGFHTPDSFRCWEALEAAAIPIVDERAPYSDEGGYWPNLLGTPPFPVVSSWTPFPQLTQELLADWPASSNRVQAWWLTYKRQTTQALVADLVELSGHAPSAATVGDLVTILMPSSPIPSHPDTTIIEQTVASIRGQEALRDAELILMLDGVRVEQEDRREAYEEYQRRVLWLANHHWRNTTVLRFEEHAHQARMMRDALDHIQTPALLFCEHDTPLVGVIDWKGLLRVVQSGEANLIRFYHETRLQPEHAYLMLDEQPQMRHGVPLIRTAQWSQRPHVAATDFYRQLAPTYFGSESRTMIEDVLHGVLDVHYREYGEAGWQRFATYLYAPPGDMQRSSHLDARETDPKFEMQISYDTAAPPFGAPNPTQEPVV